ncbi:MAG: nucleoside 2-deoxyribosyltransferase [Hyphomicrobiaceae bacterium]|nr:nucleoside 2-deoxyribosyltransferase [Hyphomicrobiaceae bacterium]
MASSKVLSETLTQLSSMRRRIYLAGPEVFLPDPIAAGRAKVALCDAHGFEGLFPLDAALDLSGLTKHAQAARISAANEGLMRRADVLIANLTPFRGVSMDSGTAFEVGFMRALGRPVFGYSNAPSDFAARARAFREHGFAPEDCDRADIQIEDFDLAENLMITEAITASGGSVVRHSGPMEDLAGFIQCLSQVKVLF